MEINRNFCSQGWRSYAAVIHMSVINHVHRKQACITRVYPHVLSSMRLLLFYSSRQSKGKANQDFRFNGLSANVYNILLSVIIIIILSTLRVLPQISIALAPCPILNYFKVSHITNLCEGQ